MTTVAIDTRNSPFPELEHDLPDMVWVLRKKCRDGAQTYAVWNEQGLHGLMAFEDGWLAQAVMNKMVAIAKLPVGYRPVKVSDTQAAEIAKALPAPCKCVHLIVFCQKADNLRIRVSQYVK